MMKTFISFKLGTGIYAFPTLNILEILGKQHLLKSNNLPGFIIGIVNYKGKAIPVVDMKTKFNCSELDKEKKYIVVILNIPIENIKEPIGVIAESVHDVFFSSNICSNQSIETTNNQIKSYFLRPQRWGDLTTMIDVDKMFSKEELDYLKERSRGNSKKPKQIKDRNCISGGMILH